MQAAKFAFNETTQHRRTVPNSLLFLKCCFPFVSSSRKRTREAKIMAFAVIIAFSLHLSTQG